MHILHQMECSFHAIITKLSYVLTVATMKFTHSSSYLLIMGFYIEFIAMVYVKCTLVIIFQWSAH